MEIKKYYFDTSIWIDIYDKRNHHGKVAKKLVEQIIREGGIIMYSERILVELKKLGFSEFEIGEIVMDIKSNVKKIQTNKYQLREARKISKQRNVPLGDVIHAMLAKENNAQLVSRDWDFERLKDITRIKRPEELIQ